MHLRPQTLTPARTPAADADVRPAQGEHPRPDAMDLAVAVVIVHYRTPHLAAQAVAALRADLAGSPFSSRFECLIVDNGSDASGADMLAGLGVNVIAADGNRGYAGGVNLGVARTHAPVVIVMNADVLVRPGCVAALIDDLHRSGAAVAGPRFVWDRAGRLLLPPTERRDFASEALARLGARDTRWARAARSRWRRHARRHWTARESFDSFALSGALLAFRRDAWDAIGPFDEGFQLYFEETDWLARLAARGWRGRYVPAATAVHLYNRSAAHEAQALAWFAASARRFEEKHVSRWRARLLRRLDATAESRTSDSDRVSIDVTIANGIESRGLRAQSPVAPLGLARADGNGDGDGVTVTLPDDAAARSRPRWMEISSQPAGYPAAAERLDVRARAWQWPADVWDHLAPGTYTLRLVDDAGREHAEATIVR